MSSRTQSCVLVIATLFAGQCVGCVGDSAQGQSNGDAASGMDSSAGMDGGAGDATIDVAPDSLSTTCVLGTSMIGTCTLGP